MTPAPPCKTTDHLWFCADAGRSTTAARAMDRSVSTTLIKQILPPLIIALAEQSHQMPARMQTERLRQTSQAHPRFFRSPISLSVIAGMAARDQVFPGRLARARTRDHVIEGQLT